MCGNCTRAYFYTAVFLAVCLPGKMLLLFSLSYSENHLNRSLLFKKIHLTFLFSNFLHLSIRNRNDQSLKFYDFVTYYAPSFAYRAEKVENRNVCAFKKSGKMLESSIYIVLPKLECVSLAHHENMPVLTSLNSISYS